jgi:ribonuclease VapC
VIVVDTSALVAIMRHEPEEELFSRTVADASPCLLSAVSLHEASLVLAGRKRSDDGWRVLDALLEQATIEIVPFDTALAHLARDAFLRFGKGRHPVALNLCDCVSYALAKQRGAPLLYKGGDFARTDIASAVTA